MQIATKLFNQLAGLHQVIFLLILYSIETYKDRESTQLARTCQACTNWGLSANLRITVYGLSLEMRIM